MRAIDGGCHLATLGPMGLHRQLVEAGLLCPNTDEQIENERDPRQRLAMRRWRRAEKRYAQHTVPNGHDVVSYTLTHKLPERLILPKEAMTHLVEFEDKMMANPDRAQDMRQFEEQAQQEDYETVVGEATLRELIGKMKGNCQK